MFHQVRSAIELSVSLSTVLASWGSVVSDLADTPRNRRRQILDVQAYLN